MQLDEILVYAKLQGQAKPKSVDIIMNEIGDVMRLHVRMSDYQYLQME